MAHYRKVDTCILLDQKFNQLCSDARLAFLHLLIHPNLTPLGAMHASLPSMACELNWSIEQLRQAMEILAAKGMLRYDEGARFVWLPNFLKYNGPESPNVVKSWKKALGYLPECHLKQALMLHVQTFAETLPVDFQNVLPRCFDVTIEERVEFFEAAQLSKESVQEKPPALQEAWSSDQTALSEEECQNETSLPEGSAYLSEGFSYLPEGSAFPSESISENGLPLSKPINNKHIAISNKHKTINIKQEEIVQKINSEEKKEEMGK